MLKGVTGLIISTFVMRLDTLCFSLGFAPQLEVRQIVNHGYITVNGKSVDIASFQCRPGDIISFGQNSIKSVNTETIEK